MKCCKKCDSTDIAIEFKNTNSKDYISSNIDNIHDFTRSIDWQIQGYNSWSIQKEHLFCMCRTCGYKWLTKTGDSDE
jgi:hypothetical protein